MPLMSVTGTTDLREAPLAPCRRGALLALDRIGVDVVARKSVFRGDEVGGDALRHEIGGDRHLRVDRPGAARRADADARHRFHAAGDDQVVVAGHHLRRRHVHRVETGGAEAVDLHARHVLRRSRPRRRRRARRCRPPRRSDRRSRGSRRRRDACRGRCGRGSRSSARRREPHGRHFVQRPVGLAAPARRANCVVDEGFRHGPLPEIEGSICTYWEEITRTPSPWLHSSISRVVAVRTLPPAASSSCRRRRKCARGAPPSPASCAP